MGGQPAGTADALHRRGEGFVERGVALHINHLVRQLVDDQPGQLAFRVSDEGVEQRVAPGPVHPAQCGIGGNTVHTHLQALRLQRGGFGLGVDLAEIPPVPDTARHGETPGLELQRQRRRGHHVPDHGFALQVGITVVTGVVGQAQVGSSKTADALRQRQPGLERRGGGRVVEPGGDGFSRVHELQVALDRLRVVTGVGAATEQKQGT